MIYGKKWHDKHDFSCQILKQHHEKKEPQKSYKKLPLFPSEFDIRKHHTNTHTDPKRTDKTKDKKQKKKD